MMIVILRLLRTYLYYVIRKLIYKIEREDLPLYLYERDLDFLIKWRMSINK